MYVWRVMMAVGALATAEELGTAPVVNVVQHLALNEEHQCAEERGAVYRSHALFHLCECESVVIRNNLTQYHQAYGCGAYASLGQYLLGLVHRVTSCGLSPHPYRR